MLAGSKRSRLAKELRHQGCTSFTKCAKAAPTPKGSVYCPSGSDADESPVDMDDIGDDQGIISAVDGLQRLYVEFLPENLWLNRVNPQNKLKRPVVYTRNSRTTAWRRRTAQEKAAEGCRTLDAFIQRKVGSGEPDEVESIASHHL
jgi:hypothetical protein